jgi:hypothetical protein
MNNKLKPDAGYGAVINGYGEHYTENRDPQSGKERFLRDAAALLRDVGKQLSTHGLTEKEIRTNPAGPAVSGEVSACFWKPDEPARRVYCIIGACGVFGGRKDGVNIMARTQAMTKAPGRYAAGRRAAKAMWQYGAMGPNQWLSPALDSAEIATELLKIFDPATLPVQVQFHTRLCDSFPVPDPVVASPEDELGWAVGMARCLQADRADATANLRAPTTLAAVPLFSPSDAGA